MVNTSAHLKVHPSHEDIALARESSRVLSNALSSAANTGEPWQIDIHPDKGAVRSVLIPSSALRLLLQVLTEFGQGHALTIIPLHAELTSQRAADVLNVSRPFLIQLLEKGDIPFHKVGTHRRVRYQDVIAYKKRHDAKQRQMLDALVEQDKELGPED